MTCYGYTIHSQDDCWVYAQNANIDALWQSIQYYQAQLQGREREATQMPTFSEVCTRGAPLSAVVLQALLQVCLSDIMSCDCQTPCQLVAGMCSLKLPWSSREAAIISFWS